MGHDDGAFGRRLRELRQAAGLSLERLAARATSSRSHIHEFETGKSTPRYATVVALDQALNACGELTALWRDMQPGHEREQDGQEMRRRLAIQALTALAFGARPATVRLEALRHSVAHAMGTGPDQWDATVTEYAHSYYATPAGAMCDRLEVDLSILLHQLVDRRDDRYLNRATANLSMMLAIALTATGQVWLAQRWWVTAREAADRSGDLGVQVLTRSQQVVKGLYTGRPLSEVLALAEETVTLAGRRVCPGVAGVLAGKAQALALDGRPDEATKAVEDVARVTGDMPAPALSDESLFGWPEHRLRHTESFVYTGIGDTGKAMEAQDRAFGLYPPFHVLNRGMVSMHRAACLIQDRHIADGLRLAADVLDATPTEKHQQLLYEVARRTLAMVPSAERRRSEFGDLRDRLVALPGR